MGIIKALVTDKHCDEFGKIYKVGDTVELDNSMFEELQKMGYVKDSSIDPEQEVKPDISKAKTKELK